MRVFFSHASEDKAVVEQVFARVAETFPDFEVWLDTYEIVGGNDLIDKIAEGIESSEKFLIFLSERSIGKPWVRAELKKALMRWNVRTHPGTPFPSSSPASQAMTYFRWS
jgi:hypothetical protein